MPSQEDTQNWVTALPGHWMVSNTQAVAHSPLQPEATSFTPPRPTQHSAQLKLHCLLCKSVISSNKKSHAKPLALLPKLAFYSWALAPDALTSLAALRCSQTDLA